MMKSAILPEEVLPDIGLLIEDCWTRHAGDPPTFRHILIRFAEMDSKTTAEGISKKIAQLVVKVRNPEEEEQSGSARTADTMN
jgi:hypothetical protein